MTVDNSIPLRLPATVPADSPLVADARRLAQLLSCGIRTIRSWDSGGKLPRPLRIGGRVYWNVEEIRAWLQANAPPRDQWEARKAASRK